MEKKFTIGQQVYVKHKNVSQFKTIKDIESFGELILYYMDDVTAYPHSCVFENVKDCFIEQILTEPVSVRDSKLNDFVTNMLK